MFVLSVEFILKSGAEQSILTWAGGNFDQVGSSFMVRRDHCTPVIADLCLFGKSSESPSQFLILGVCVRATS